MHRYSSLLFHNFGGAAARVVGGGGTVHRQWQVVRSNLHTALLPSLRYVHPASPQLLQSSCVSLVTTKCLDHRHSAATAIAGLPGARHHALSATYHARNEQSVHHNLPPATFTIKIESRSSTYHCDVAHDPHLTCSEHLRCRHSSTATSRPNMKCRVSTR